MKLLILGGGRFLGAAALAAALRRGHAVTVFNRGRSRSDWPEDVEHLSGDRDADLAPVAGRAWDGVLDTCGYLPRQLRSSSAALQACGRYLFVSSVSAYASFAQAPVHEQDALADAAGLDPDDRRVEAYGAQKAACEGVVAAAFGARALVVRPGFIVGPGDFSGRFSHWPWRCAAGGEMLVPDVPEAEPLQLIDVRDLADWMIRLLEDGASGAFNAVGPLGGASVGWPRLADACADAVRALGLAPATPVRVGERFLVEQGVEPWSELPLWIPSDDPAYAAFNRIDATRAWQAGLRTRPLAETLPAILAEGVPAPDDPRRRGKLDPEKEAQLIARWRAR